VASGNWILRAALPDYRAVEASVNFTSPLRPANNNPETERGRGDRADMSCPGCRPVLQTAVMVD
jgi:hypothetical protein